MNPGIKFQPPCQNPRRSAAVSQRVEFDPYWLEVEHVYNEHCDAFPEEPAQARIFQSPCRRGFFMPVTTTDVRQALARVPKNFLVGLQAVFLLGGTRKQLKGAEGNGFSYGCYWADCVFLFPFPIHMLTSVYPRPPKPSDMQDYARVGAEITTGTEGTTVRFARESLKRFYLRDILIHEIGHHVDRAHLGHPKENEAYARWFATEYGFRLRKSVCPRSVLSIKGG